MTVNQSQFIKDISVAGGIDESIVRNVLKTAEKCMFGYLSSATQSEQVEFYPLKGIKLYTVYTDEKALNINNNINMGGKVYAKSKITKRYNQKLNS